MDVKWKPRALAEEEENGGHRLNRRTKGKAFNDQLRPSELYVGVMGLQMFISCIVQRTLRSHHKQN